MACERVRMPDGCHAIVCGGSRRQRCECGRDADRLCDWRGHSRASGTCDKPVCTRCSTKPARGKDLCPEHARAFEQWRKERA